MLWEKNFLWEMNFLLEMNLGQSRLGGCRPAGRPARQTRAAEKKENMENIFLRLVVVAALGFWGSGLWSSGLWWVKKWDVSLLFALLVGERLLIEAQHHNNGIHTEIEIGRDNNPLNISLSFLPF